ncbi:hypothetical protein HG530_006101 [Fusarium avenaceum]|nr:hypothetical protein HG530_006101 [Fusarium avenaceum]
MGTVLLELSAELCNVAVLILPAGFHSLNSKDAQQNLLGRPNSSIAFVLGLEVTPDVGIANSSEPLLVGVDETLLEVVDDVLTTRCRRSRQVVGDVSVGIFVLLKILLSSTNSTGSISGLLWFVDGGVAAFGRPMPVSAR